MKLNNYDDMDDDDENDCSALVALVMSITIALFVVLILSSL